MKLRDRLWCWRHCICPKHFDLYGRFGCKHCAEEAHAEFRTKLERIREEVNESK
jgi:hypothetical protein